MSADDQRAAEDVMTELHECTEGVNPYGGMAARALAVIQDRGDEVDRLRAELAETRAAAKPALELADALLLERARLRVAGDELARAVRYYDAGGAIRWSAVQERAVAWRSVRGDAPAPAEPPDTELAAAVAWFREDPKRLDFAPITEWSRHLRTIVRAYLGRPVAVQPRPADDPLRLAVGRYVDHGPAGPWKSQLNEALIQDARPAVRELAARPAVARTDGQPPADERAAAALLQQALDQSTTDDRCDPVWVAELAARVRAVQPVDLDEMAAGGAPYDDEVLWHVRSLREHGHVWAAAHVQAMASHRAATRPAPAVDTAAPDPLADVEIGDDDPIGPYEPAAICGATAYTGNRAGRMECLRAPHPEGWLHVSACDDQVDYVWRDLRADELEGLVMTSEGVVCRVCNLEATTSGGHFAGCSASGRDGGA